MHSTPQKFVEFFSKQPLRCSISLLLGVAIASGQSIAIVTIGFLYLTFYFRYWASVRGYTLYVMLFFLVVFFMAFDHPVSGGYGYLTQKWIVLLALSAVISYFWGYSCLDLRCVGLKFYWVGMVAFSYGALSIILTLILLDPPFYGEVFDVIHWRPHGAGSRVAELMLLVPIFLCGLLVTNFTGGILFKTALAISIVAFALNSLLEKRIFFLTIILVLPMLYCFLSDRFLWPAKLKYSIIIMSFCGFVLYFFRELFVDKFLLEYSRNGGRVWLYRSFFESVWTSNGGAIVTPVSKVEAPLWFHNIFMDVYRLSGMWPFVILIMFFAFFFARLYQLSRIEGATARFVLCLFFPVF